MRTPALPCPQAALALLLVGLAGCRGDAAQPGPTRASGPPPAAVVVATPALGDLEDDPGPSPASTLVPDEPLAGPTAPGSPQAAEGALYGALSLDDGAMLVVLEETPEPGRAPAVARAGRAWVALGAADATASSAHELVGRTVRVVGDHGICEVRLERLALATIVTPHFGTAAQWEGTSADFPGPATAPSRIVEELVQLTDRHHLVAVSSAASCGPARVVDVGRRIRSRWIEDDASSTDAFHRDAIASAVLGAEAAGQLRAARRAAEGDESGASPTGDSALDTELRRSMRLRAWSDGARRLTVAWFPLPGPCGGEERVFVVSTDEASRRVTPLDWAVVRGVVDVQGSSLPAMLVEDAFGATRAVVELGGDELVRWAATDLDCAC